MIAMISLIKELTNDDDDDDDDDDDAIDIDDDDDACDDRNRKSATCIPPLNRTFEAAASSPLVSFWSWLMVVMIALCCKFKYSDKHSGKYSNKYNDKYNDKYSDIIN